MKVFSRTTRLGSDDSHYNGGSFTYYFDIKDSIPIYCQKILEIGGDAQYDDYRLQSYQLNNFDSIAFFSMIADSLRALSNRYPLLVEDSLRAHRSKLSKADTMASDFVGVNLNGDTISLNTLSKSNKLILLDFWYLGCLPCKAAIPSLISLYNTYHNRGLEIVGLNPFDTNRLSIENRINKMGINYELAHIDTSVVNGYKVHGFPTLFLIDKKKILFYEEGYNEGMKEKLGEMIEKYLR